MAVTARPATAWGDWRLDDLAHAMERASRILSASAQVFWVALLTPSSESDYPTVQVVVPDRETLDLLRDSIADRDEPAHFQGDLLDAGFQAEVDELHLQVWCTSEGFQ
jgi:hypothetical protein